MGPAGGRGRKSILPSSPRPSPSCGLKWGTRWAWLRWRLCPAGAPVERNPCPTPGASMSCTACAKVRLGLACLGRKGPRGWAVLPAGTQRWEQERAIAPGFRPQGGPGAAMDGAFCCRTGKEVSSSKALAVARTGTASWGRGSTLCSLLPSLPPTFRCLPRTDGGREARGQQGSEQPFPGAPTSLALPHCASCPAPPSPSSAPARPGCGIEEGGAASDALAGGTCCF